MKPITEHMLRLIAPKAPKDVNKFVPWLAAEMCYRQINTLQRASMFLAQLAHESDGFRATEEYASGRAYEGRRDLGNVIPGDGVKYKGRGLIMLTGRDNYKRVGESLGIDLVNLPKLLSEPEWAVKSAGLFWEQIKGNGYADLDSGWRSNKGRSPFEQLTTKINGGLNGILDRKAYYQRAVAVLPSLFQ